VHPFLDHPGPIPFAHRGGAGEAPENTLVSFEIGVTLEYRYGNRRHITRDEQLLDLGVDGIISDRLRLLLDVLRRHRHVFAGARM